MRRIPSLWVRLTALGIFLIVLLIGMVGLTMKAIRPYRQARFEASRLADTRRQVADLDRSNADLQRQISYLNTSDGVASEAHKMGYVRPGEIPLVIEGAPAPADSPETAPTADSAAPAATSKSASLISRFWHHLLDL